MKQVCHNAVMKKRLKLIWKFYSLTFCVIAGANFIWLIYPESEPYVFYHILMTWTNFFIPHYYLAILKSCMTIVCLYPLFAFSFNREPKNQQFWQWMLVLRMLLESVGNYYEFVFVKSSYHMILGYGLSVTGAVLLPLLPAYIAHYLYAFARKH